MDVGRPKQCTTVPSDPIGQGPVARLGAGRADAILASAGARVDLIDVMIQRGHDTETVLVTGATGFVGQYVLAELLRRGFRCAALVRPPLADSMRRLGEAMGELGFDLDDLLARQRVVPIEGDLAEGLEVDATWPVIRTVVHVAASTRFERDARGEPMRSNVTGTRNLIEAARQGGIESLHVVSSAYSCGRTDRIVPEAHNTNLYDFHNAYEASKWAAEGLALRHGEATGCRVTILRPSIVVGEYATGRCSRFGGWYLGVRATQMLDRVLADADDAARHAIPLRLHGRPEGCQNIVPVDYVATMIGAVVADPSLHGRVYHLVNPSPPTNDAIRRAIEAQFDVSGGRFVEPRALSRDEMNEFERLFYDLARPIEHYMIDTPRFDRRHAEAVERAEGIVCPRFDEGSLRRLMTYACETEWGRRRADREACSASPSSSGPSPAFYFESFLPRFIPQSNVARMAGLTTTVGFSITDAADGRWVCRFEQGQLASVRRGGGDEGMNGRAEFSYVTTRQVFAEAIAGRVPPQELFLSGRAQVVGDVERALKMAMILHAFTLEFPCGDAAERGEKREACP